MLDNFDPYCYFHVLYICNIIYSLEIFTFNTHNMEKLTYHHFIISTFVINYMTYICIYIYLCMYMSECKLENKY